MRHPRHAGGVRPQGGTGWHAWSVPQSGVDTAHRIAATGPRSLTFSSWLLAMLTGYAKIEGSSVERAGSSGLEHPRLRGPGGATVARVGYWNAPPDWPADSPDPANLASRSLLRLRARLRSTQAVSRFRWRRPARGRSSAATPPRRPSARFTPLAKEAPSGGSRPGAAFSARPSWGPTARSTSAPQTRRSTR